MICGSDLQDGGGKGGKGGKGWSGVGIRGVDVDGGVDMYEV